MFYRIGPNSNFEENNDNNALKNSWCMTSPSSRLDAWKEHMLWPRISHTIHKCLSQRTGLREFSKCSKGEDAAHLLAVVVVVVIILQCWSCWLMVMLLFSFLSMLKSPWSLFLAELEVVLCESDIFLLMLDLYLVPLDLQVLATILQSCIVTRLGDLLPLWLLCNHERLSFLVKNWLCDYSFTLK